MIAAHPSLQHLAHRRVYLLPARAEVHVELDLAVLADPEGARSPAGRPAGRTAGRGGGAGDGEERLGESVLLLVTRSKVLEPDVLHQRPVGVQLHVHGVSRAVSHDGSREPRVVGVWSLAAAAAAASLGGRRGQTLRGDSLTSPRLLSRVGLDNHAHAERGTARLRRSSTRTAGARTVRPRVEPHRGGQIRELFRDGGGDGVANSAASLFHNRNRHVVLECVHHLLLEVRVRLPSQRCPVSHVLGVEHDALVVGVNLLVVDFAVGVDPAVSDANLRRAQAQRPVQPRRDRGGDLASRDILRGLGGCGGGGGGSSGCGGGCRLDGGWCHGGREFRRLLLEDVPELIDVVLDKDVDVPVRLGLEQDDAERIRGDVLGFGRLDGFLSLAPALARGFILVGSRVRLGVGLGPLLLVLAQPRLLRRGRRLGLRAVDNAVLTLDQRDVLQRGGRAGLRLEPHAAIHDESVPPRRRIVPLHVRYSPPPGFLRLGG